MKIGIIGSGRVGKAFAAHASKAGYDIIISGKSDIDTLEKAVKEMGTGIKAGSVADAVATDVVFIAVPFENVKDAVSGYDWNSKIVIDATNAVTMPDIKPIDTNGRNSSEVVSDYLKGAMVVKAFNTLPVQRMAENPSLEGGSRVLFFSGNHQEANTKIGEIIKDFGFEGIYLGKLNEGGMLQQLIIGPLSLKNLISYPL
ncbi:hypothetical protein SAMN05421594_2633 [Chryseobacterium oleae]|uniref:Pyrroline-5-carboxylate reductase catalytic N-terminal domain-containing protein n=1 Tax=Chryseobacterium oleae TaxID=491207 RepID=A0A1I4YRK9_CHROL|nr:NAD(P)-binding domain-containing protein [Chryseobacterium oleae]SFN40675.1 hypothetical protein SAMN05421594_2633 [Chryseobacterium oleae]